VKISAPGSQTVWKWLATIAAPLVVGLFAWFGAWYGQTGHNTNAIETINSNIKTINDNIEAINNKLSELTDHINSVNTDVAEIRGAMRVMLSDEDWQASSGSVSVHGAPPAECEGIKDEEETQKDCKRRVTTD